LIPNKSLKAFTGKLIDYAGLFPPADLSLSAAFLNFFEYKKSDFESMLSRFICPVKLFPELKVLLAENETGNNTMFISALSSGGSNVKDFEVNFERDLGIWKEFISDLTIPAVVDSFEMRLPDELLDSENKKDIQSAIDNISNRLRTHISNPVFLFLEGSSDQNRKHISESLIDSISNHNLKGVNTGFKFRTGGVNASSFPAPEQIAFCIRTCLDRKVPMKFTAGLHHPFRHYDKAIGAMMHGFINVFGTGIIAMRHNISDKGIEEILRDEDPDNFIFTDEYFSWKDWKIETDDIEFARKDLVLSFGSCSFDEPVEDLISLNLLQ
jgi:hypothetical protein